MIHVASPDVMCYCDVITYDAAYHRAQDNVP